MSDRPSAVLTWAPYGSSARRCRFHSSCAIGRAPDNRIIVSDPEVSRHHAVLTLKAGLLLVRNVSRAGTVTVGTTPLPPGQVAGLRANDTLVIGSTVVTVLSVDATAAPRVLRCVNSTCNRSLSDGASDCPWCGTSTAFAETHPGG